MEIVITGFEKFFQTAFDRYRTVNRNLNSAVWNCLQLNTLFISLISCSAGRHFDSNLFASPKFWRGTENRLKVICISIENVV